MEPLFRIWTPRGYLVVRATDEASARNKAMNWLQTEFDSSTWNINLDTGKHGDGSETKEIGIGEVKTNDRLWTDFNSTAGTVTGANFKQVQDNFVAGNPWHQGIDDGANGGSQGPPPDPLNSKDLIDPVMSFLTGLGFDFGQGATGARDFQQNQGRLGEGTFAGQRAADFFDPANTGQGLAGYADAEAYGAGLGKGGLASGLGAIGTNALKNIGFLSSLKNKFEGSDTGGNRAFANPYTQGNAQERGDLQSQGVADLITAAFQGAGVSPIYNRGPSAGDISAMFTRFAGDNPTLGGGGVQGSSINDQNFLDYAAKEFGLNRFF